MAEISEQSLKDEVTEFLKGADLAKVTSKKVREHLSEKLDIDLNSRRKEIDALVMAYVHEQQSSEEVSDEETNAKTEELDGDDEVEEESSRPKPRGGRKRKTDDDEDWGKKKKKPAASGGGGPRKQSAFTKSFKLSPELADVVGAEIMPRHEVVKKLWAVIKERNLQDPKQKQFAICDEQLLKVFGIKRFRTFGMMKYLKDHFVEAV